MWKIKFEGFNETWYSCFDFTWNSVKSKHHHYHNWIKFAPMDVISTDDPCSSGVTVSRIDFTRINIHPIHSTKQASRSRSRRSNSLSLRNIEFSFAFQIVYSIVPAGKNDISLGIPPSSVIFRGLWLVGVFAWSKLKFVLLHLKIAETIRSHDKHRCDTWCRKIALW